MTQENPHEIAIRTTGNAIASSLGIDFENADAALAMQHQLGIANASPMEKLQMLIVCKEHGLNPMTKEIYAFPQNGKLQPLIGFDGWIRIANSNPSYNGHEFAFTEGDENLPVSCRCTIHRKDRDHPIVVEEFYAENFMPRSPVWKQRPRRMLMIRAFAQAVRQAFGVSGISHDMTPEEAGERVKTVEANVSQERKQNNIYADAAPPESALDVAAKTAEEVFTELSEAEKEAIRQSDAEQAANDEEARAEAAMSGGREYE